MSFANVAYAKKHPKKRISACLKAQTVQVAKKKLCITVRGRWVFWAWQVPTWTMNIPPYVKTQHLTRRQTLVITTSHPIFRMDQMKLVSDLCFFFVCVNYSYFNKIYLTDLDLSSSSRLSHSAARHKLAVRPKKKGPSRPRRSREVSNHSY